MVVNRYGCGRHNALSLTEYAVSGALVLAVSAGVWMVLGSSVAQKLDFFATPRPALSFIQSGSEAGSTGQGGSSQEEESSTTTNSSNALCFKSGVCVANPQDPRFVETTGALGADPILANIQNLDLIARELRIDGVDSEVADWVGWLAQNGHIMGNMAYAIEHSTQGCALGDFCPIEGNRWDSTQLLNELKNTTPDSDRSNGGNWKTASVGNFLDTYERLKAVLAKKPDALDAYPEAKAIIEGSVRNIQNLIKDMEQTVVVKEGKKGVVQKNTKTSKPIHTDATTICNNGGNNCS